ncbi:hypothetical protein ACB092_11G124700 [Castanea dentata]
MGRVGYRSHSLSAQLWVSFSSVDKSTENCAQNPSFHSFTQLDSSYIKLSTLSSHKVQQGRNLCYDKASQGRKTN